MTDTRSAYIGGPMSGIMQGNLIGFRFAQDCISRSLGIEAICPIDIEPLVHDGPCPTVGPAKAEGTPHGAACHLRADIAVLVGADMAIFLPGWQASAGSRLEMMVATQCGIPVFFFNDETGNVITPKGEVIYQ